MISPSGDIDEAAGAARRGGLQPLARPMMKI